MGLAITSQLVNMMNGKIWVESEPGKGSVFHFTCRLGVRHGLSDEDRAKDLAVVRDKIILVVDDNEVNRKILKKTIESWGMKPVMAESAGKALEIINSCGQTGDSIAIALIDVMMPEIDGFKLTEMIRNDPKRLNLKIIIMSSADQTGGCERCAELGVDGYLCKPLNYKDLLHTIAVTLSPVVETKPASHPPVEKKQTSTAKTLEDPVGRR